jgi:hypothetical protein
VRGLLQRDLVLDGHPVGEDQHAAAGGDRVRRLRDRVLPGDADDGQRGAVGEFIEPGADRALRDDSGGAGRPLAGREGGVHGRDRGSEGTLVLRADRNQ